MIYRETRLERWPVPSCNGMTIEQVAEGVKESALGYYGEQDDLIVERVALLEDHVCDDNCEEQGREYDGVPPCEGMGWRDLGVTVTIETRV